MSDRVVSFGLRRLTTSGHHVEVSVFGGTQEGQRTHLGSLRMSEDEYDALRAALVAAEHLTSVQALHRPVPCAFCSGKELVCSAEPHRSWPCETAEAGGWAKDHLKED